MGRLARSPQRVSERGTAACLPALHPYLFIPASVSMYNMRPGRRPTYLFSCLSTSCDTACVLDVSECWQEKGAGGLLGQDSRGRETGRAWALDCTGQSDRELVYCHVGARRLRPHGLQQSARAAQRPGEPRILFSIWSFFSI